MANLNDKGKIRVVGVRFSLATTVYYFEAQNLELNPGDGVVVETQRGPDLAWVIVAPHDMTQGEEIFRTVLRKATQEDMEKHRHSVGLEEKALKECSRLVAELGLPMKPVKADYSMEGNAVTIFFTAEGRVDFRNLVRQLSSNLGSRVELRQVGPRDEARLLGGFGPCGRPLCCSTFLTGFTPVSIKMAKDQDLALNPENISGVCGRLLCCLGYEHGQYRDIKSQMPPKGSSVLIPGGKGIVMGSNVLRETVVVQVEGGEMVELPLSQVSPSDPSTKN